MMRRFVMLFLQDVAATLTGVEAVKSHRFVPGRDEVTRVLLFCVILCMGLPECAQLRI